MIRPCIRLFATAIFAAVAMGSTSLLADQSTLAKGSPQTGLPKISLRVGSQNVRADVASTEATRQLGLMYRKNMGKNEGMLFVFPQLGYHAMWMRNTLLPLSVAYLDDRGVILSIHEMQPLTEVPHQSAGPARYALEMNAGWFGANKIRAGDIVKGVDKAPKPQ
jgi:uncharacterized membrane protein (UPF0127 family)